MKTVKLPQTDLALTSTMLDYMQNGLIELKQLSKLGGDNYILTGCVITGSNVSAGYVVVNGDLLEFKAGVKQDYFLIRSVETTVDIQEGSYTKIDGYAEFGTGVGQIAWNTLYRIKNLQELESLIEDVDNTLVIEESEREDGDALLQAQITNLTTVVNSLFKTGMIMPFMGTEAPEGWLLCNGSIISPAHADLIAMIGSNTPNLNGLGIVGAGTRSIGSLAGNDDINISEAQMPAHTHDKGTMTVNGAGAHRHAVVGEIMQKDGSSTKTVAALDTGSDPSYGNYTKYTDYALDHSHALSGNTGSKGNGDSVDIRNKSMAANFIIKI